MSFLILQTALAFCKHGQKYKNRCIPKCRTYWAIQAGLLTPLTFARHRLSPLAALLPVRTFFGDSEFGNFTLPTLKAFLEARSQNVSGNKQ